jgi:hypothetical protein
MKHSILVALVVGSTAVSVAQEKGFLDTDVVISGNVTSTRGSRESTIFTITGGETQLGVKVSNEHAYGSDKKNSLSYKVTRRFQASARVTAKLADRNSLWKPGDAVSPQGLTVVCVPAADMSQYALVRRNEQTALFAFECASLKADGWNRDKGSEVISVIVGVRAGTAGDSILSKPRTAETPIYLSVQ